MIHKTIITALFCVLLCGCASVLDAPKNVLGFSRRALTAERENSSYQVYQASLQDVFGSVTKVFQKEKYTIFTSDEIRGCIAVMDIPGVVNTTEVGVFIEEQTGGRGIKVELSSRSTPAKRTVAALLFSKLGEMFTKL